jgi:hypothetical protein
MAGASTIKWIIGVAVALLLVAIPANCIDWNATQRAADAAARAQVAVARALDAERAAAELRVSQDSIARVRDALSSENARLRGRLAAVRAAVPPAPPSVPGCEACEDRARALEQVLLLQDSSMVYLVNHPVATEAQLGLVTREAALLRSTVGVLREELATRTAVKPVLKSRGIPLPGLTVGYGGIIVPRDNRLAVVHGPAVTLGYRIPLPRLF